MWRLRLVPKTPQIRFLRWRRVGLALSLVLMLVSAGSLAWRGLNFGIDFEGGILMEVGFAEPPRLAELRARLNALAPGELTLQTFGAPTDILIRIAQPEGARAPQSPDAVNAADGAEAAGGGDANLQNQDIIARTRAALHDAAEFRRVEVVGPQVSGELVRAGATAIFVAVALMLAYIWFRFEWQFSLGAVLALVHDVLITLGVFSLLQLDFNLSILAALLTIVGYSMNDTVVIYDRVREMLRKYKRLALPDLLDLSLNSTFSRTVMTSVTTLLALLALYFLGGEVIRGFTFAMIFGVVIGTYSSMFIACPLLHYVGVKRNWAGAIAPLAQDGGAAAADRREEKPAAP